MAQGEFAQANQCAQKAVQGSAAPAKYGATPQTHDIYAILAEAACRQRDIAALREYAPLAYESAAKYEHALYLGLARRAMGVLRMLEGDYAGAERELIESLAGLEKLRAKWQVGRTLSEFGELELVRGSAAKAREYFGRAREAFESLGAKPDAAKARKRLEGIS